MKRSPFLAAILSLSLIAASTPTFWDIASHPRRTAIEELQSYGVVGGYSDGSFKPNAPINRAEFLKILMLSVYGEAAFEVTDRRCFTDFTGTEQWYWVYACSAKNKGIISGYPDGTFRGTDTIILAEALKMVLEAWDIPLPQYFRAPDNWYDPYMDAASGKGIFNLFPFVPGFTMTRGDMAALIIAMDEPIIGTDGEVETPDTPVPPPPGVPAMCGNNVWETGEQCDDGNTADGDGCSSICIVVPEPVRRGALELDQKTLIDIAVTSGAKDVPLLQFDAAAGRQDVYITKLRFKATSGVLSNAENYRLYIDSNGDGSYETLTGQASPQGSALTFNNLSILVKEGIFQPVELRADIINTLSTVTIGVAFDTATTDYVAGLGKEDGHELTGIETDGSTCTSTCWIAVKTQTPRIVSIGTEGNLYVTKDTTSIPSRQLLGGELTNTILRVRFYASGEDIQVDRLAFEGGNSSIDHLELSLEGGGFVGTARTSQCPSVSPGRFCAQTSFVVPRNTDKKLLVKAVMKTDAQGAQSGDTAMLSMNAATTGVVAVQATGDSSGQQLSQNDGDSGEDGEIFIGTLSPGANSGITGATNDVVFARINSIQDVHPDADFAPVPLGTADIATFRFTSASNNNVSNDARLRTIVFTVQASNVAIDSNSFAIFNTGVSSTTSPCTANATTGTITVTCANLSSSSIGATLNPGQSSNFGLRATITNPNTSTTSTLQVSLQGIGNRATPGTVLWSDEASDFDWVDVGVTNVLSTIYRRS